MDSKHTPGAPLSDTQHCCDLKCPFWVASPLSTCVAACPSEHHFPAACAEAPAFMAVHLECLPWDGWGAARLCSPGVTDAEQRCAGEPWPACLGGDVLLMLSASVWGLMNRNVTGN